jgi:spore coat polysaccharide biosynthesis protein SpsF
VNKVVAILQARTTSTRLPGKVLMDLAGEPMLAQQLRRLFRATSLADVVVATTVNAADDEVVTVARNEGARVYRGSEFDVLSRYHDAARYAQADVIIRVTADCPLLDPDVVNRVVDALDGNADYASNVVQRTFPIGLDVEAIRIETLAVIHSVATSPEAREHVTWYILQEQPDLFRRASVVDDVDNSDLRWTVDTAEDIDLVRRLFADLGLAERPVPYAQIVEHVRAHPELATANVAVE